MAEYIKREDLIRRFELSIKSWSSDCNSNAPVMVRAYKEVVHRIENIPAADVVEVVRCKDCKFSRQLNEQEQHTFVDGVLMCESYEMNDIPCAVYPEDYCSYGERKCESE